MLKYSSITDIIHRIKTVNNKDKTKDEWEALLKFLKPFFNKTIRNPIFTKTIYSSNTIVLSDIEKEDILGELHLATVIAIKNLDMKRIINKSNQDIFNILSYDIKCKASNGIKQNLDIKITEKKNRDGIIEKKYRTRVVLIDVPKEEASEDTIIEDLIEKEHKKIIKDKVKEFTLSQKEKDKKIFNTLFVTRLEVELGLKDKKTTDAEVAKELDIPIRTIKYNKNKLRKEFRYFYDNNIRPAI